MQMNGVRSGNAIKLRLSVLPKNFGGIKG